MGCPPPLSSCQVRLEHPAFCAGWCLHFDRRFPGGCEVWVDGDAKLNAHVGAKESINNKISCTSQTVL